MRRKLMAVGAAGFILAALAGCAQPHYSDKSTITQEDRSKTTSDIDTAIKEITLPDGGVVTCILTTSAAISCDWDHVRRGE